MLLVAVPLVWLGFNLADHVRDAVALIKDIQVDGLPEAPNWLGQFPLWVSDWLGCGTALTSRVRR